MRKTHAFSCMLLIGLSCAAARADEDGISVTHDAKAGNSTIEIRAQDGRVAWGDVLRGLARAKGYDDSALAGALPDSSIALDKLTTALVLAALNAALKPHIQIATVPAAEGQKEAMLRITLNRAAVLSTSRAFKLRLRRAFTTTSILRRRGKDKSYALELDKNWQKAPPGAPLVVLVHGLQSAPEDFADFREMLRKEGMVTGAIRYPNDQPVASSAALLSAELRKVALQQKTRPVALVATSMGGLVCRWMLEQPKLDPGNVSRLIMVGTPNHGSRLAEFSFALEFGEHVLTRDKRSAVDRFYQSVEDGLGEAYDDLTPGSGFLKVLNARKRNPAVLYTLLLGSGAFLQDKEVDLLRAAFKRAGKKNRFVRFFGPRLDKALSDMDEVKRGKGDGAVSIARGRLDGVEDTVVIEFDHLGMVNSGRTEAEKRLRREIIRRLKADAKKR